MTIAIGLANPDIGFLIADTLLTASLEVKGNPAGPVNNKFHALKIQILNPDTAVAFAGDVDSALTQIHNLYAEIRKNSKLDVCGWLSDSYKAVPSSLSDNDLPDYLVLELAAGGKKLTRITSKAVTPSERAYIGDSDEYKKMVALRVRPVLPIEQLVQQPNGAFVKKPLTRTAGEIEFEEISRAIEKSCDMRRGVVGAIAGSVTRVVDARASGKLEYLQSREASLSPEEGRAGFNYLASNSDVRGIGIYFPAGKVGFISVVADTVPCRREFADTERDFIKLAHDQYGLNLE
jgi:hypothetical protein